MDDIQKRIVTAIQANKDSLKDHGRLKNVLSDVIPNDRVHLNLILNAYDDQIYKCFFEPDATLSLLRFISSLVNGYGISEQNALWSVITWCYVFGKTDIANALISVNVTNSAPKPNPSNNAYEKPKQITCGVYKAGIDFPVGTVRIVADLVPDNKYFGNPYLDCTISKKTSFDTDDDEEIEIYEQGYLETKKGDYIKIVKSFWEVNKITIEKVAD